MKISNMTVAIAAAAMALCATAAAQTRAGVTLAAAGEVLSEAGLPVEIATESGGDPAILSDMDGVLFELFGVSCSGAPASCDEFLFSARFEAAGVTLDKVNAFNEGMVAGRAYLSSGGAYVEHFFTVEDGVDAVEHNLAVWSSIVRSFAEAIGEGDATS